MIDDQKLNTASRRSMRHELSLCLTKLLDASGIYTGSTVAGLDCQLAFCNPQLLCSVAGWSIRLFGKKTSDYSFTTKRVLLFLSYPHDFTLKLLDILAELQRPRRNESQFIYRSPELAGGTKKKKKVIPNASGISH